MNNNNRIDLQDYITNINEKLMMQKPVDSIKKQQETLKQYKDKFAPDIYSEVQSVIKNTITDLECSITLAIICETTKQFSSAMTLLKSSKYTNNFEIGSWPYVTMFTDNRVTVLVKHTLSMYAVRPNFYTVNYSDIYIT